MAPLKDDWAFVRSIIDPMLLIAPSKFLSDLRAHLAAVGVGKAIAAGEPGPVFDWMMPLIQMQGISNRAAATFAEIHGLPTWTDIETNIARKPPCPRLQAYWTFRGCGFRRSSWSCAEPQHLWTCPLPSHRLRKGVLNEAAFSLFFFIRDICAGDFGSWIDERLDGAASGKERESLLDPLREVVGVSDKLWSMILADLLLGCEPKRERWIAVGATFVVVDTLVHAFLDRTGVLTRMNAVHPYGTRCYAPGGCAEIIRRLASGIDARTYASDLPSFCPRFVQHAIWRYCAEDVMNICNGRKISAEGCFNWCCPVIGCSARRSQAPP